MNPYPQPLDVPRLITLRRPTACVYVPMAALQVGSPVLVAARQPRAGARYGPREVRNLSRCAVSRQPHRAPLIWCGRRPSVMPVNPSIC